MLCVIAGGSDECDAAADTVDKSYHYCLRLCQLKRWPNRGAAGSGNYGFQLCMSRTVPGQFIVSRVEPHSASAAGGLLPGDHLIQVTIIICRPVSCICLRGLTEIAGPDIDERIWAIDCNQLKITIERFYRLTGTSAN